jgi:hypothetical protein
MDEKTYSYSELKRLTEDDIINCNDKRIVDNRFKKFILNDIDNYIVYYNREHLYDYVKVYAIETNDFYIFTLRILFTKISLYMKSISEIVDTLMEYHISYI